MNPVEYLKVVNRNRRLLNPLLGASIGGLLGTTAGNMVDYEYAPHIGAVLGAALGGGIGHKLTKPITAQQLNKSLSEAEARAVDSVFNHNMGNENIRIVNPELWNRSMVTIPKVLPGMDLSLWGRPQLSGALLGATAGALYDDDKKYILGGALAGGIGGRLLAPKVPTLDAMNTLGARAKETYLRMRGV